MSPPGRLADRHPRLGAAELVAALVPPRRFAAARFDTYEPSPDHPSQRAARDGLRRFAEALAAGAGADPGSGGRRRWFRRASAPAWEGPPGRYLDGGYGVGKTHLLAALWHDAPVEAAYLTFAELTALIGFLGMEPAVSAFGRFGLLCIDEFELDDVANTLMAVTFLRHAVADGAKVVTTSNSLPDRLGEGRFHAADFRREIAAIADHFSVMRIDGPDYRARTRVEAEPADDRVLDRQIAALVEGGLAVTVDELAGLVGHLRRVHPVQYHAMVEGLDAVVVRDLVPITNQGDALLLVHLVDELYDAGVPVVASGCAIAELFPPSYRAGGYRKKYGRCESRLAALLAEGHDLAPSGIPG